MISCATRAHATQPRQLRARDAAAHATQPSSPATFQNHSPDDQIHLAREERQRVRQPLQHRLEHLEYNAVRFAVPARQVTSGQARQGKARQGKVNNAARFAVTGRRARPPRPSTLAPTLKCTAGSRARRARGKHEYHSTEAEGSKQQGASKHAPPPLRGRRGDAGTQGAVILGHDAHAVLVPRLARQRRVLEHQLGA